MKPSLTPLLLCLIVALGGGLNAPAAPAAEWRSLFNGRDFSGWDKYVASPAEGQPAFGWNNEWR